MKISLSLLRAETWFGGDFEPVLRLYELADAKGIDQVNFQEHLVMADDFTNYPGPGRFPGDARTPFMDPVVMQSVVVARTRRLRVSTSVMLAPLRPAIVLAKELATLDLLSGGRLELGVGTGWQKAEYDAEGLPFEGRFGRMIETIEACRALWTQAPASHHGKHIQFDGVYCLPRPIQPGGIPVLFGIGPSERNLERIARFADGWAAPAMPLETIAAARETIFARMRALGRDTGGFRLRLYGRFIRSDDAPDWEATRAHLARMAEAGASEVNFSPRVCCPGPDDYEAFLDKLLEAREAVGRGER
jgi:probable F420-dependent oxidoreductase